MTDYCCCLRQVFSKPPEQRPDVVVAKDCHGLNAGSMLLRHTPWTLQHLADAWAATWVRAKGCVCWGGFGQGGMPGGGGGGLLEGRTPVVADML
jgi:hypothetical protein